MENIIMPQVGQDVTWARIVSWHKKEGDLIEEGELICEVESDKATLEVEAEATGVMLKILHFEGEKVDVFKPIAIMGAPGEKVEDAVTEVAAGVAEGAPAEPGAAGEASAATSSGSPIAASPAAKRLAREKGIELASVKGTGPGGRITQEDVEAAAGLGGA